MQSRRTLAGNLKSSAIHPGIALLALTTCTSLLPSQRVHALPHSASITWSSCAEDLLESFPELRERTSCGKIQAPLDHHAPSKGSITLDIVRVAANSAAREGSIFMNPGGPGGGSSSMPLDYGSLFRLARAENPVTRGQHYLNEHFDLIAVEPRGLGPSFRFHCRSEQQVPTFNDITTDRSEANLSKAEQAAQITANGCLAQPEVRYITTEQTAMDMELVRAALGDEKLNYFGASYGTWLGSWYGRLFPERIGRMVLDSNVDWSSTFDNAFLAQSPASQRSFEQFTARYVAARPAIYGLGRSSQAIIRHTNALLPSVLAVARGFLPVSVVSETGDQAAALLAAHTIDRLLRADPALTLDGLNRHLAHHRFSRVPQVDELTREFAEYFAERLFSELPPASPLDLGASASVYATITCNDSPNRSQPVAWRALGDDFARRYPVGGSAATLRPCMYWGDPSALAPPLQRLGLGDGIVMVQPEFDKQTPKEGAFRAFARVPNASMIYLPGEVKHVVYAGLNRCADKLISDFLAFGIRPGRLENCPRSAEATPRIGTLGMEPVSADYSDPARAAEIIERIRRTLDRSTNPLGNLAQ